MLNNAMFSSCVQISEMKEMSEGGSDSCGEDLSGRFMRILLLENDTVMVDM